LFQGDDRFGPGLSDREHRGPSGRSTKAHPVATNGTFLKADPDYDTRVAKGLDLDLKEVERLAVMSQDERVKATSSSSVQTQI
jgi:hypothetical protein